MLHIVNASGTPVVSYTYDPYGKPTVSPTTTNVTLAEVNPLRYRGYVYDSETGFYYLQSRYYDPSVARFINADTQFDSAAAFAGCNLFSYCANSPISLKDSSGCAIETVLDVIGVVFSLAELIGSPSWSAAGYLVWDVVATIIPFVPGSYLAKGGKIAIEIASKIDDFADGAKFLTGTYNKLKKLFKGIKDIEIHHLIEKRFFPLFSSKAGDFLSIPLTKELHQIITNRWRNLHKISDIFQNFAYGSDYTKITYELMVEAVKQVYRDMPAVLDEVLEWLSENWR